MKIKRIGKAVVACILAASLAFSATPMEAKAASSSEIRNQISELKEEKAELQEQINELRGQYKQNENEMLDLVASFDHFEPIDPDLVAKDSLLREFIGGCTIEKEG